MPREAAPWIFAAGVFNLALAAFHLSFWRLFNWPRSLAESGDVNRSVTQILNLAVTYLFGLSALVCFMFPAELASSALGRFWLVAMASFWLARALIQPSFFGLRHTLSLTLFGLFIVGAIVHGTAWALARGI
jgi:Na+-transporting NADH:ubiquinone oxidoreductase subunit NqrD